MGPKRTISSGRNTSILTFFYRGENLSYPVETDEHGRAIPPKKTEMKEAEGYMGKTMFAKVEGSTNAWVECGKDGKPIFDRGEVEVAKKFAAEFPSWEVRVTIGPYRGYDIIGSMNKDEKVIYVDLYSPRPGLQYVPELIENGKKKLQEWNLPP